MTCVLCERSETFRGVVPSLVTDAVAKAGWGYDDLPRIVRPDTAVDGCCPTCAVASTRH